MRRAAKLLNIHRITVARKLKFLAEQARLNQSRFLESLRNSVHYIQFDEMESFEHTKLKPLTLPIAVTKERKILACEIGPIPAKGPLAAASREKYGRRMDGRPSALNALFGTLKQVVIETAEIDSDMSPHYPDVINRHFPHAKHFSSKGRKAAVVGQGELKKGGWDPLFCLNHTAAMLRANMNRLVRKTWCTTKKVHGLRDHLDLYIDYHNQVLTR